MRRALQAFPDRSRASRREAVDPDVHAALSGVGGDRQDPGADRPRAHLLLSGARPETILCLTFTKAGAAEMANRIGAQLAAWVRLPDKDLQEGPVRASRAGHDPIVKERARRLFAKVLEAPGGLRIQTIHSFAQTLLASFPAEAGIAPGFQPIEGRAEQELARTTLADLARGRREPRQRGADRRCAMPQPAAREKARRSII